MNHSTCSVCEQPVELMTDDPYHVDTGLQITINTGYGMFADGDALDLITCHSCSIRLLELFPEGVRNHYRGGHDHDYPGAICQGCEYNEPVVIPSEFSLEELWQEADKLMQTMDIPEQRRRDHRWIARNAHANNRENPDLLALCMLLVEINELEKP